jgi:hypothetical protein
LFGAFVYIIVYPVTITVFGLFRPKRFAYTNVNFWRATLPALRIIGKGKVVAKCRKKSRLVPL